MKLLDLYCGAGGAAMGYFRAGITDITGIDINPMPRYPFKFIQADALEYLKEHGEEYDMIHASPPCQRYSRLRYMVDLSHYPDLVDATRELIHETGLPYVIENVPDAPLHDPFILCGTMFGLRTHKHRAFETDPKIYMLPGQCNKARVKPKNSGARLAQYYTVDDPMITVAGGQFSKAAGSMALDIDWMTIHELAEAIPPAFTEWIGKQMLNKIGQHSSDEVQALNAHMTSDA